MNKIFAFFIIIFSAAFFSRANAQQEGEPLPIADSYKLQLVDSITAGYTPWSEMSFSGKLSSPMLPMSASVKVYMVKDEFISIAVSAPLIGEVARMEIDGAQILAVNKFNNTYSTVEMAEVEPFCPGGLTAIQNLLLGRISLLGSGELCAANASDTDIYSADSGDWLILPRQDLENGEYVYYYMVDKISLLLERFMVMMQNESDFVEFDYGWKSNERTIDIFTQLGARSLSATLKLNAPDSKTKKMERFELTSKYRKVAPKGLLKM